jgi:putative colanic acid biosynthesis acetyltransferase WcaF
LKTRRKLDGTYCKFDSVKVKNVQTIREIWLTPMRYQDLRQSPVPQGFPGRSKYLIQLWYIVNATLFRMSPHVLYGWRRWLLRRFGARIGQGVKLRPSCQITYPWNVSIGDHSYIGDETILYSLGRIDIGAHVSISYRAFLCTGSHEPRNPSFPLTLGAIMVEDEAWVAADVFIFPGVRLGQGAVIGARSTVRHNMPANTISSGDPCMVRCVRVHDIPETNR